VEACLVHLLWLDEVLEEHLLLGEHLVVDHVPGELLLLVASKSSFSTLFLLLTEGLHPNWQTW